MKCPETDPEKISKRKISKLAKVEFKISNLMPLTKTPKKNHDRTITQRTPDNIHGI
jgi:hypothetical protein